MVQLSRDLVAEQYVILTSERAVELIESMMEEEDPLVETFSILLNQIRPGTGERCPIDVAGHEASDLGILVSMGLIAWDEKSDEYFIPKKIAFAKYYSEHYKEKLN